MTPCASHSMNVLLQDICPSGGKGFAKPGSSLQEAPNPRGSINDSPDVERHFDELDPLPWLTQVWTTLAPGTH